MNSPLLQFYLYKLVECYRIWSGEESKADKTAMVFYVSDYRYSARLSQAI